MVLYQVLRQAQPAIRHRSAHCFANIRIAAATFHQGSPCLLKESEGNDDARAQNIEAEKQDQLKKQTKGEGHWKTELASESEEVVKADRDESNNTEDDIKKMQEKTQEMPKKEHNK